MPTLERLGVAALRDTMTSYRDVVRTHAGAINRLNVYPVPDGDTGTNMARTLDAVVDEVAGAIPEMVPTCRAISHGSLMGARGNSGVILSQILRGLVGVLQDAGEASGPVLASALRAASVSADGAVLRPVEGTILTVARETAAAAEAAAGAGATVVEVLCAARDAGAAALARTPDQLPVLREAGVVDAGGAGFLLLLDAALHVVDGRPLPEPADGPPPAPDAPELIAAAHRGDVSELRYEVMYFLDLDDDRIDRFRQQWAQIGDSIVVVGGDGLWNCHVHTDDIGAAVEAALDAGGRPRQIRVTDLAEQVAGHAGHDRAASAMLPPVTTAVVAVAVGDGLVELFGQLGVQGVVAGGQTMNPSTAELLEVVEAVNADQVIVLPNNRNIIPVAEQLDAFTAKAVRVVPTRSMPEALAALVAYDPEAGVDANATSMGAAAAGTATGEITHAVRDTSTPAEPVRAGDWIGLVRDEGIVAAAPGLAAVAVALLERLVTGGHELLTVIDGEGATLEATAAIARWLADARPEMELETHHGGQPLYPYLFGVE